MRKATLAFTAVIALLGTAAGVGVGASTTPAAVTAAPQEAGVFFRRHAFDDKREMDACFFGDFPKTRRNGDTHYNLPIIMIITNKDVRRKNELTGKSERLPGSKRVYRLNPGTDFRYNERLEETRGPFYLIWPWRGNTCMHVGLVNAAPARSGQALTLTGKFRWRIASGGRLLGDSHWGWKIESYGGGAIYEDEDAFVNVCIDNLKKLYSRGGRLYCLQQPLQVKKLTRLG